jgi:hypothetical protein
MPLVLMIEAMMIAIVETFARLSARGRKHDECQQEKGSARALDVSQANSSISYRERSTGEPEILDAKVNAICHDRSSVTDSST